MTKVSFETNYGKFIVELYPETVKHRANFIKLVNSGYYDGLLFHRVIANFMIQAGDPKSKNTSAGSVLGSGDVSYTIPAEFIYPQYYHKRGALAAARQGDDTNPKKASSGAQFYIVQGHVYTVNDLRALERKAQRILVRDAYQKKLAENKSLAYKLKSEKDPAKYDVLQDSIMREIRNELDDNPKYKFSKQQIIDYTTIGGTPHLDGEYTVFGEVIEGLDVIDKISKVKVGKYDRPIEDVKILSAKCL
ncbi:MAG: peptidylprolyl isomerase [Paludibacter sp.]|nr:peptidylprolyl isomerase [Paludibacter sp.]